MATATETLRGVPDVAPLDHGVNARFWQARASLADDPRSVTLSTRSLAVSRFEVECYQGWLFETLAALGVRPDRVLDLGCGNGDWTVGFRDRARHVIGIDLSPGFVDYCRKRVEGLDTRTTFQFECGDAARTVLPADLDLVVAGGVAQYLEDEDVVDLLARIAAALAPGGLLYFRTTLSRADRPFHCRTDAYQATYRTAGWYVDALEGAGLRVRQWTTGDACLARGAARAAAGGTRALAAVLRWPLLGALRMARACRASDTMACLCSAADGAA